MQHVNQTEIYRQIESEVDFINDWTKHYRPECLNSDQKLNQKSIFIIKTTTSTTAVRSGLIRFTVRILKLNQKSVSIWISALTKQYGLTRLANQTGPKFQSGSVGMRHASTWLHVNLQIESGFQDGWCVPHKFNQIEIYRQTESEIDFYQWLDQSQLHNRPEYLNGNQKLNQKSIFIIKKKSIKKLLAIRHESNFNQVPWVAVNLSTCKPSNWIRSFQDLLWVPHECNQIEIYRQIESEIGYPWLRCIR